MEFYSAMVNVRFSHNVWQQNRIVIATSESDAGNARYAIVDKDRTKTVAYGDQAIVARDKVLFRANGYVWVNPTLDRSVVIGVEKVSTYLVESALKKFPP